MTEEQVQAPVPSDGDGRSYFHAIENLFIDLRGAPLLLSPADWQIAKAWREAGIPLELVQESLETIFRRREERGAKGKVQSLRYCRDAVESAWEELQELSAPGQRESADAVDADLQTKAILKALPKNDLVDRLELKTKIASLEGPLGEREKSLQQIEDALYEALQNDQSDEERDALEKRVASVLADLPEPLTGEAHDRAAERLRRQILRRRNGLPVLTLFG